MIRPNAEPATPAAPDGHRLKLHPDVLRFGLVSFLTDLSSEMIFSVFAIFFTTIAGASSVLLGLGMCKWVAISIVSGRNMR